MQPFIVNWSSATEFAANEGTVGKTPIVLANLVTNASSTSLVLTGRGTSEYGEIQQENFVKLLENFASKNIPPHPTVGQTWFCTTDNTLYVCAELSTVPSTMQKYHTAAPLTWVKAGASSTVADVTSAIGYQPVNTVTVSPVDTSGVLHFTKDATGSVINLSITQSTASANGYLSSTDWGIFNAKVTYVGATAPIASSGGKTPTISISQSTTSTDGFLGHADWNTFNDKITSISFLSPLVSTNGKTPSVSMPPAASGVNGYLAGGDWSIFNAKVTSVSSTGPIYSSGGKTPNISLAPSASGIDGYLTGSDWNTFNAKVTSVSASGPVVSSGGKTPNISMPGSNSVTDGYLSSGDWGIFNAKVTSVGAAGPVVSSGGKTPSISIPASNSVTDGYLSAGDWGTFNAKVTSVTASGPLSSSGGKTPNISLPVSNSVTDGYLSASDWGVFNNKQNALSYSYIPVQSVGITSPLYISGWSTATNPSIGISLATASTDGYLSASDWDKFNKKIDVAGGTMTAPLTLSGDPTLDNQAATKHYVDTTGVTYITAGANISISSNTGSIVISSTGGSGGSASTLTEYNAGSIVYFAMNAAPTGFLAANGALVSRVAYPDLFAAIGTTYGAGDGSTTFKLPELRGEFIRGWDAGRGIDVNRIFGSWQADDMKSHTHSLAVASIQSGGTVGGVNNLVQSGGGSSWVTGATGAADNRPRNIALLACIKAVNTITSPVGITIADDASSAAWYYPTMSLVTSGVMSSVTTSANKFRFQPATGSLILPQLILGDGSYARPSIAFGSDGMQDTGFCWGGDGYINFVTQGVYGGQISPGGNLQLPGQVSANSFNGPYAAFTSQITVPTQASGDSSTNAASTAFVHSLVSSTPTGAPAITGTYQALGNWTVFNGTTLPAGGVWVYHSMSVADDGNVVDCRGVSGIAAGGSYVQGGNNGGGSGGYYGFAWRIA
jgi:microcystin-dependent protein